MSAVKTSFVVHSACSKNDLYKEMGTVRRGDGKKNNGYSKNGFGRK